MAVITWLHLSDWHQHGNSFDRDVVRDAVVRDIQGRAKIHPSLANLDFIFFTGDLANYGIKTEYEAAGREFLEPVRQAASAEKDRLFLIPGNHDIDRSSFEFLPTGLQTPFADDATAQKWLTVGKTRDRLLDPFEAYDKFVAQYGVPGFGAFARSCVIPVKGVKIGLFGCNSALMCARNKGSDGQVNDLSFLTVGEMQIRKPLDEIAEADLRIGLIHHPFEWLREFDRRQVEPLLKGKCHFILRGHEHVSQVEIVNGTNGKCIQVPAGASYDRRKTADPIYVNAYNFVTFDTETQRGTVYLRCLNRRGDEWIADTETSSGGQFPISLPKPRTPRGSKAATPAARTNGAAAKAEAMQAARLKYLEYVCDRWANLEQRGVQQTGKAHAIALDDVYVSLTAERDIAVDASAIAGSSRDGDWPFADAAGRLLDAKGNPIMNEDGWPLDDPAKDKFRTERRTEKIGLPEAVRECQFLVALGDPGSGKTTLVRFIARQFAIACRDGKPGVTIKQAGANAGGADAVSFYGETRLPILVRVSDYAEALKKDRNLKVRDFLYHARGEAEITDAEATATFESALAHGAALVILDGLDEVAQSADRGAIARAIDDFAHGIGARNRILVTSRISGYQAARLNPKFVELRIRDMDTEQIARFVTCRVTAYERAQTPGLSNVAIEKRAATEIASILDAVQNNVGVKRLAVNPLLLSILCLIHRSGKRLPERRVELYEIASKTLLEDWRPAQTGGADCAVSMAEADRLLAPLADWMHEHTDRGLIREEQARDLLLGFSAARHGKPKNDPEVTKEVESFWRRITYDTSVFVERSQGEYAFLHLTFEEYWAARHLVRDFTQAPELLRIRRHKSRFTEVLMLAIASQTEENATNLIRSAIWCEPENAGKFDYEPSLYEHVLCRDLLLAARAVGDCVGVEPSLANEIGGRLAAICLNRKGTGYISPLVHKIMETMVATHTSPSTMRARKVLITACKDNDISVRCAAVDSLGSARHATADVVPVLLVAAKDENASVRYMVMDALGTTGQGSVECLNALLVACKDKDEDVRFAAMGALGAVSQDSDECLNVLLDVAKDENEDEDICYAVIDALGIAGQGSLECLDLLLAIAKNENARDRYAAIRALGAVGKGSTDAITVLLAAAKDENTRYVAINALAQLGQGSAECFNVLFDAAKEKNVSVRYVAISALGDIGQDSIECLNFLITAATDENAEVRYAAVMSLRTAGQKVANVIATLLTVAKDTNVRVRSAAVGAIGVFGQGSAECLNVLFDAAKEENVSVRYAAINALANIGQGTTECLNVFIAATRDESAFVRCAAVVALGSVGQGTIDAITALLTAVRDEDANVRGEAWDSLMELMEA